MWSNDDWSSHIDELLSVGEYQEAATEIELSENAGHASQHLLLKYANRFSDPRLLFDLILNVYVNDGYGFPKRLILLAKRLAKHVPAEYRLDGLPDGDMLTVYRGTFVCNPDPLCARDMRTAVSWTTDKNVAIWFANRIVNPNSPNGKGMVWEGTIARDKIIAFTQCRDESEVL